MDYEKTFDEELAQILTDYRNQSWTDPETGQPMAPVDISQGSLVFIKSAALASAKWGLHQHQQWVARQIFADTADTAKLEHWCWLRGIYREAGETDAELLARLLADLREPPAGGNQADYVRWALEVENVAAAWCSPLGNGVGTVDVLILADAAATGSETPSQGSARRGAHLYRRAQPVRDARGRSASAGAGHHHPGRDHDHLRHCRSGRGWRRT